MTNIKTIEPKKEPKKSTMKSMTAFRTLCGNKLDATEVAVEDFAGIVDLNPDQVEDLEAVPSFCDDNIRNFPDVTISRKVDKFVSLLALFEKHFYFAEEYEYVSVFQIATFSLVLSFL